MKLRHLDRWNAQRRRHAARYCELLADVPEIELPAVPRPESHVWHLFVVLVRGMCRDALAKALGAEGIATGVHYPTPVPLQPAYAVLGYQPGDFPAAEDVMARCLSLPMFAELTEEQLVQVADAVRTCVQRPAGA